MIMSKPIITSDLGFARSICGDAAIYFKAKDAETAANQIERIMDDTQLQETLIVNGHRRLKKFNNPRERAKLYLDICKSIIQGTNWS